MKNQGLITAITLTLLLTACQGGSGPTGNIQVVRAEVERDTSPESSGAASRDLVGGNTAFAFDLYHQAIAEKHDNLIFSPLSISQAFAMVYAGSRGETEQQMAETFHYTLPQEQLHPAFNALDLALQPGEPQAEPLEDVPIPLQLAIANAVWGQEGYEFLPEYLEMLALHYGAGLRLLDFTQSDAAREVINAWVAENTRGRIKDIAAPGSIQPTTKLVLTNAIYFKGEWAFPFSTGQTRDAPFTLLDGSTVSVPMMLSGSAFMRCGRGANYQAVELTYGDYYAQEGVKAAMLLILPDDGQFEAFESSLDSAAFERLVSELEETNLIDISLPRFKFESGLDLKQSLSAMGMTRPFEDSADFSGLTPGGGLYITHAVHKSTISVDEVGTEATGATMIAMAESAMMSSCDSSVVFDHPFIFAIYEKSTGAVLFLGRVLNPAASAPIR